MQLRQYQRDAVDAAMRYIGPGGGKGNPVICAPTGSGKSVMLAELARMYRVMRPVIVLAHRRELIEQNAAKLQAIVGCPVGVYSAGLNRRDTSEQVVVAQIQSVYKRAHELGPRGLTIVDEAHLIPSDGDGMYRRFLGDLERLCPFNRVVGLTATPYRTGYGLIAGKGRIFDDVVYDIPISRLIEEGYLCNLTNKAPDIGADWSKTRIRNGEFHAASIEEMLRDKLDAATASIDRMASDRKSVIVFTPLVSVAEAVCDKLGQFAPSTLVTGDMGSDRRDAEIDAFRRGKVKYLVNVNVLTTGFDAPNVDCVVLLRPTMSPGLYVQMVGRGMRPHSGKENCLVLDYGGNIRRHGPVDEVDPGGKEATKDGNAPVKECPKCAEVMPAATRVCPACGHEYPPPDAGPVVKSLDVVPDDDTPILAGNARPSPGGVTVHTVTRVTMSVHHKRNAPPGTPRTVAVRYKVDGSVVPVIEYLCPEHEGFAFAKFRRFWEASTTLGIPESAEEVVQAHERGDLTPVLKIQTKPAKGGKYTDVINRMFNGPPKRVEYNAPKNLKTYITDDDIPF